MWSFVLFISCSGPEPSGNLSEARPIKIGQNEKAQTPSMPDKAKTGLSTRERNNATSDVKRPYRANKKAPDTFHAVFSTTVGDFLVESQRTWSPAGVDRFYNLIRIGFFNDISFYRAVDGFMVQFGIHGDPKISQVWLNSTIKDDPLVVSNRRGFLTFAKTSLPNTRSTQLFINLTDNPFLDGLGFSPIARVIDEKGGGMAVVDRIYTGYGDSAPEGKGPAPGKLQMQGNEFLKKYYPELDYLRTVWLCGQKDFPEELVSLCP